MDISDGSLRAPRASITTHDHQRIRKDTEHRRRLSMSRPEEEFLMEVHGTSGEKHGLESTLRTATITDCWIDPNERINAIAGCERWRRHGTFTCVEKVATLEVR